MTVALERVLGEVRHPGSMLGGFRSKDGHGLPHISKVLKPNTRRRYSYPDKSYEENILNEDGMTPRGVWHYRRNSAILRGIEKTELED